MNGWMDVWSGLGHVGGCMDGRVEWPGAHVWSSRPTPRQLRMIRRGLIGRVRGKTPMGGVGDLCPLHDLKLRGLFAVCQLGPVAQAHYHQLPVDLNGKRGQSPPIFF